jgi:hypothetical protein
MFIPDQRQQSYNNKGLINETMNMERYKILFGSEKQDSVGAVLFQWD